LSPPAAAGRYNGMGCILSPQAGVGAVVIKHRHDRGLTDDGCWHAGLEMKGDRTAVMQAVTSAGITLEIAPVEFRDDKLVVLAAVQQNGLALQFASDRLRNEQEVGADSPSPCLADAARTIGGARRGVTVRPGARVRLLAAAVRARTGAPARRPVPPRRGSCRLTSAAVQVLAAVSQDGWALQHATDGHKSDDTIVKAAVGQQGMALGYAHERCRADPSVVNVAVKQNGGALYHAHESLQQDVSLVLTAIRLHPHCAPRIIKFAHSTLRADPAVVLAAVAQRGRALQYAEGAAAVSAEVVRTAVGQNGNALSFAPVLRGPR
jgi:hypothetical protein